MSRAREQASDFTIGTPHPFAASTSSQWASLASLGLSAGSFVLLQSDGCKGYFRFGAASLTVDGTTRSTVSGGAVTATAANAPHVRTSDGLPIRTRIPIDAVAIAFAADSASGLVMIANATGTG